MTITVTKNALSPPVIDAGPRGTFGNVRLEFDFSSDWNGLTTYIVFYTARGQAIEVPYLSGEIDIPVEVMAWGGVTRYNVVGVEIEGGQTVTQLKVSGQLVVTFNPGENPRLAGRITPTTLELFLSQAEAYIATQLQSAKDSGAFKGDPGDPAGFGIISAAAETLPSGSPATASVTASGSNREKNFSFLFGIPKGKDAEDAPNGLMKQGGLVYLMRNDTPVGEGVDVDGEDGKNFTILGHYNSLSDLQTAHPHPRVGDAYGIGAATPYNVYVYDGVTNAWANYGVIGTTVDSEMSDSSANPVQNSTIYAALSALAATIPEVPTALKNPYAVSIFGQSYDGSAAVTVSADDEMSSSSTKPVQNKIVKAYIDDLIGDVDTALASIAAVIGGGDDET